MEEGTKKKTPTKLLYYMSPSSQRICILCMEENFDASKLRRLWGKEGEKLEVCKELEEVLSTTIMKNTDFQYICRLCLKKNQTHLQTIRAKKTAFENSRKLASRLYVRTKVKRLSSQSLGSPSKKRLHFDDETEITENYSDPLPFRNMQSKTSGIKVSIYFIL